MYAHVAFLLLLLLVLLNILGIYAFTTSWSKWTLLLTRYLSVGWYWLYWWSRNSERMWKLWCVVWCQLPNRWYACMSSVCMSVPILVSLKEWDTTRDIYYIMYVCILYVVWASDLLSWPLVPVKNPVDISMWFNDIKKNKILKNKKDKKKS